MVEEKIKEIQTRIKSCLTRKDDNAAVVTYYDSMGECWQAWINIVDSWGIRMCYGLGVEAGSYEESVLRLHEKIHSMSKKDIKQGVKK